MDLPAVLARLQKTADNLGLPFTTRTMTYNSRAAQELSKWAEHMGCEKRFHQLVFEAYFAQGRNIAQLQVLRNIASAAGLDPDAAEATLKQGVFKAAVDQDWQRCRDMGITAVPTFFMGDRWLVGAQNYEAIRQLALAAGAVPPPPGFHEGRR